MCTTDTKQLHGTQNTGLGTEGRLRQAIDGNELTLHYQPQVSLGSGRIIGVEALVRWQDAERGLIYPGEFIPLAERTGLIDPLDDWVMRTACRQARAWSGADLKLPRIAVNLSGHLLQQADVVQRIEAILLETGVDPTLMGVEVTESMLMHDVQHVARALTQLKAIGLEISLDDFGTGYSSLSYLRNLPIDVVKIDRSFVNDVTASPQSVSMTRAIISMAHSLHLTVLAEGVETEGQLALLIENQCDQIQGFYFSRAVPPDELAQLLREGRGLPAEMIGHRSESRTLLLVDDEENIAASLRRLLRRDGYEIVVANSGAEGLQRLAEHKVSVIVSDQRMPGMTGVEFLRRAKELYPDTIRMVLSGYTELQSVADAINEGAIYKFLTKPWDDAQLREHIAEAFRQKEMADENLRLNNQLKVANIELNEVNRRLKSVLEVQREQITKDEARLGMAREILECIPIPLVGIDIEGVVAFANAVAENVIAPDIGLIGRLAADVLHFELRTDVEEVVTIRNRPYKVSYQEMTSSDGARGWIVALLPA